MVAKSKAKRPKKNTTKCNLWAHASGQWAKKIKGKIHYFGPWADPGAAEQRYLQLLRHMQDAEAPIKPANETTVVDLCNQFMSVQSQRVEDEQLTRVTEQRFRRLAHTICDVLGDQTLLTDLSPAHFRRLVGRVTNDLAPTTAALRRAEIKVIFRWAYDEGLTEHPVRYGKTLAAAKTEARKHAERQRIEVGEKHFERDEIHAMLDIARPQQRLWILLGCNLAYSHTDLSQLRREHIDGEFIQISAVSG